MMGNEVKVKVEKFAKFISIKYFNKLKFLNFLLLNYVISAAFGLKLRFLVYRVKIFLILFLQMVEI
jgi:hypothetical protein